MTRDAAGMRGVGVLQGEVIPLDWKAIGMDG